MFQIKVVEKVKTQTLCSITVFRKSWGLWENVEKYGRPRPVTNDYNMAYALHVLDN